MSRLSMYLLGITKSFDVSKPVSGDAYKQLEQVPQPEMVALENGPYRDMIGELAQGGEGSIVRASYHCATPWGIDQVSYRASNSRLVH